MRKVQLAVVSPEKRNNACPKSIGKAVPIAVSSGRFSQTGNYYRKVLEYVCSTGKAVVSHASGTRGDIRITVWLNILLFTENKMSCRFDQSFQFGGIVFEHVIVP